MNNLSLETIIYLMGVLGSLNDFFMTLAVFGWLIPAIVVLIGFLEYGELPRKATVSAMVGVVLWLLVVFGAIVTPSEETMEKIVAVHIGKELIAKTPQELKDELSKLPTNVIKKLNEVLVEDSKELMENE